MESAIIVLFVVLAAGVLLLGMCRAASDADDEMERIAEQFEEREKETGPERRRPPILTSFGDDVSDDVPDSLWDEAWDTYQAELQGRCHLGLIQVRAPMPPAETCPTCGGPVAYMDNTPVCIACAKRKIANGAE